MRTDVAYEVIDNRNVSDPLGGVGIIKPARDSMQIFLLGGQGFTWPIPDDDNAFEDHESEGTVVLHCPEGLIVLERLTLSNFQHLEPFFDEDLPEFETDDDVNRFFYQNLTRGID